MRTNYNVEFSGETLVLRSDKTLWWPERKILFASDLHAGKTEHMRRYGVAIPSGSLQADLVLLQQAINNCRPQRLVFLGDLFHSELNDEWDYFAAWCRQQSCNIELVRGNHDRFLSDEVLQAAGIIVHPEPYQLGVFTLRHHPANPNDTRFSIAGHLHPVVKVRGPGKDVLRLPCFTLTDTQIILPSFGSFTGGYEVDKTPLLGIYACAADASSIIQIR